MVLFTITNRQILQLGAHLMFLHIMHKMSGNILNGFLFCFVWFGFFFVKMCSVVVAVVKNDMHINMFIYKCAK